MLNLHDWLLQHPNLFRVICFSGLLFLFAILEIVSPRRKKYGYVVRRWASNLSMVAIDSLLIRVVFPVLAVEMALISEENSWGLFRYGELSYYWNLLLGFLILDLVIYFQHVLFHAVPTLWNVHRVHHADLDFDVTTGNRFHPIEMILSMGIKISVVVAFGITPIAVLLFEVVLNATSMFTHTNIKIPLGLDRLIRWVLVTPDMHRVHHSIELKETNSNFGFNLSVWDRLFGTYRDQPKLGHEKMIIGIEQFRDPSYLHLKWLLAIPFNKKKTKDLE